MSRSDFVDYVVCDLLLEVEGVKQRAMFGGHSLYKNGVIFALIADDVLYFKVDDTNRKDFEKRGSEPFTYESRGKRVALSYWEVPAEIMDDRDAIARWVAKSCRITRKASKPVSPNSLKGRR